MLEQRMQQLEFERLHAQFNLENAQLFSLVYEGQEFMHAGGKPDATLVEKDKWANSEIVMFPIVGPADDFQIEMGGRYYNMSQHGIARNWPFTLTTPTHQQNPQATAFTQIYHANTPVPNPKYVPGAPEPAEKEKLFWPFTYALTKTYELRKDGLHVEFAIKNFSANPMPYAFGWHPAFKIGDEAMLLVDGNRIDLEQLRAASGQVLMYGGAKQVKLATEGRNLEVLSDTGNFMVWSPKGSKLLCIEPVTRLPSSQDPLLLLESHEEKRYFVDIKLAA
jgi:galactose mutarotase-like enzyme